MANGENEWWRIVRNRVAFFATVVGCILIDSGFVAIWAIMDQMYHKYVVNWLQSWFESNLINQYVFPALKVGFDIITLAIVLVFLYADFKRIVAKVLEMARQDTQVPGSRRADEQRELRRPSDVANTGHQEAKAPVAKEG